MEIHPELVFGVIASALPFVNHNGVSRSTGAAHMFKQRPLAASSIAEVATGLGDFPNGQNAIEDALIVNQASVDRGLFGSTTFRSFVEEEGKYQRGKVNMSWRFGKPSQEGDAGVLGSGLLSLLVWEQGGRVTWDADGLTDSDDSGEKDDGGNGGNGGNGDDGDGGEVREGKLMAWLLNNVLTCQWGEVVPRGASRQARRQRMLVHGAGREALVVLRVGDGAHSHLREKKSTLGKRECGADRQGLRQKLATKQQTKSERGNGHTGTCRRRRANWERGGGLERDAAEAGVWGGPTGPETGEAGEAAAWGGQTGPEAEARDSIAAGNGGPEAEARESDVRGGQAGLEAEARDSVAAGSGGPEEEAHDELGGEEQTREGARQQEQQQERPRRWSERDHLRENGLPKEGHPLLWPGEVVGGAGEESAGIRERGVLIGHVPAGPPPLTATGEEERVRSLLVSEVEGGGGIVDAARMDVNRHGVRLARVRLRASLRPEVGDKFTSRHGQKGVIGRLMPAHDLPWFDGVAKPIQARMSSAATGGGAAAVAGSPSASATAAATTAAVGAPLGVVPDVLINPHALPSRMTLGQLFESVFAKLVCSPVQETGGNVNVNHSIRSPSSSDLWGSDLLSEAEQRLRSCGYSPLDLGKDIAYCGVTGRQLEGRVFVGPTYYLRLKHLAADKRAARAYGSKQMSTRQPTKGRAQHGGMRMGEMERDCLVAHGAAHALSERLSLLSDATSLAVCSACRLIATGAGASGGGALGEGGYDTAGGGGGFDGFDGYTAAGGAAGGGAGYGGYGGYHGGGGGGSERVCQSCGRSADSTEVCMPYAMKLLFDELRAMGISVRVLPSHG
ncbi:hypothetical protein CLOM_g17422 [Closterium sp. NIES-68]|nr:hypothetical protein CLOM_g17422 [Closterium sp. NIES-68]